MNNSIKESAYGGRYIPLTQTQKGVLSVSLMAALLSSFGVLFIHTLYGYNILALLVVIVFACGALASMRYKAYSRVFIAAIVALDLLLLLLLGIFLYGAVQQAMGMQCTQFMGGQGSCINSATFSVWSVGNYFLVPVSVLCIIGTGYQIIAALAERRK